MPYATPQDLISRLGPREALMISRSATDEPDLLVLADALAEAEEVINGHVGRRYALPLTLRSNGQPAPTPSLLTRLAIDIARYQQVGTEIMETEGIRNRYKDAMKLLADIAEGKVSLGDMTLAGAGGPAAVAGVTTVRTGDKEFGNLSGVL
jgi:phage gp36-like protein